MDHGKQKAAKVRWGVPPEKDQDLLVKGSDDGSVCQTASCETSLELRYMYFFEDVRFFLVDLFLCTNDGHFGHLQRLACPA